MTTEIPKQSAASPRYELLHPLGQGGIGSVYVALHRETDTLTSPELCHAG